jgi:hypothetical protein
MPAKGPQGDVARLICIAALLWPGYVAALAVIDHLFYPHPLLVI